MTNKLSFWRKILLAGLAAPASLFPIPPAHAQRPDNPGHIQCLLPNQGGHLSCRSPDGATVATAGTTTSGLEEGLRAACDNNLSMYIGGSSNGAQGSPTGVIHLSTPLDFRSLRSADGSRAPCPIEGKTIDWGWMTLNWTVSQGEHDGITFDSAMTFHFRFDGQVVYQGTGCAVAIVPTHPMQPDNFVAFTASEMHIGHPASQFNNVKCLVKLDASLGPIQNSNFSYEEINGTGCPDCKNYTVNGIELINAVHGISGNHFRGGLIHGFTGTGILCGANAADGPNIRSNWFDTLIAPLPSRGAAVAIDAWCGMPGFGNEFNVMISAEEAGGRDFTGIKIEHGARSNLFITPRNDAAMPIAGDATYKVLQTYIDPSKDLINVPQGGVSQWGVSLGACGSGSSINPNSTRGAGTATVNGTPTSCIIDFTAGGTIGPFARPPTCIPNSPIMTGRRIAYVAVTAIDASQATFSFVDSSGNPKAAPNGTQIAWHCSL